MQHGTRGELVWQGLTRLPRAQAPLTGRVASSLSLLAKETPNPQPAGLRGGDPKRKRKPLPRRKSVLLLLSLLSGFSCELSRHPRERRVAGLWESGVLTISGSKICCTHGKTLFSLGSQPIIIYLADGPNKEVTFWPHVTTPKD